MSATRFDHVLVNEYQDTNRLQASVLLALKPNGKVLTVVGDDAQAIYSFRAATVRNILDFPRPLRATRRGGDARAELSLDAAEILAAANAVIGLANERFTTKLWSERESAERPKIVSVRDETDQARYVVETGLALKAVLFRASHHSGRCEVELTRRNIPFGLKFLEAAHIKDMLALLRLPKIRATAGIFAQLPRHSAIARHRTGHRRQSARPRRRRVIRVEALDGMKTACPCPPEP